MPDATPANIAFCGFCMRHKERKGFPGGCVEPRNYSDCTVDRNVVCFRCDCAKKREDWSSGRNCDVQGRYSKIFNRMMPMCGEMCCMWTWQAVAWRMLGAGLLPFDGRLSRKQFTHAAQQL